MINLFANYELSKLGSTNELNSAMPSNPAIQLQPNTNTVIFMCTNFSVYPDVTNQINSSPLLNPKIFLDWMFGSKVMAM